MLRSMYSGISGMKNFQTKLDVIGNNISNVSTFGYKKSRITFNDMVNQTIAGATGPGNNRGGRNPQQVGLGSSIGTIDTVHTQGNMQTTGRPLDLAVEGDGFFVVGTTTPPAASTDKVYTRAGNFYMDNQGYIVNSEGRYLLDVNSKPIQIDPKAKSYSIGSDGKVTYVKEDGTPSTDAETQTIAVVKFANPEGLTKVGNNSYKPSPNSGAAPGLTMTAPGAGGTGTLQAGKLEMSNVDLSEEFTEMIVAQRGFQANSRIITTSDSILEELVNLKR
ncbi:MAG: flagellar basal body rod protein FlgG [Bacilli bacterium]